MSTSRGSGGGGGNGPPIPASSRKMVQSLREIVSCSEAEIYAALKDCNMDPNEAVNRLLSQDPFHEVKSKREKKKEGKDTTESRPRGPSSSSTRGGKSGADRYLSRGGSTPYNYSESASLHGKSAYKKENGSTSYTSSASFAPAVSGNNRSSGPTGLSDGASADYKGSSWGVVDSVPSGTQPYSAYHSAWTGVPGQASMADIVKMGRPHNTAVNAPNAFPSSKVHESGVSSVQDDWPSMEKPGALKATPVPESTFNSEVREETPAEPPFNDINQEYSDAEEDQEETLDDNFDNSAVNDRESLSISSKENLDDDFYRQQAHDFEHHEVEELGASVSSASRNLQQLSVKNDDAELPSDEDAPSVVIPEHLQAQIADCSHLSFGSFRPGNNIGYSSGNMTSAPVETNLEGRQNAADVLSDAHPGTRNYKYYADDSSRDAGTDSSFHRTGVSGGSYDAASSASQREELKPEIAEVAHGNQYPFPSSNLGYSFDDAQRLNATFNKPSPDMQNLASLSNIMQQSYTSSSPSTLLAANVHPSRESELQYQFSIAQAMAAAKYGNSASNAGGSAISISEALKTANMTPPAQNLAGGASVAAGSPLPQHLGVHPYSQPAHPLGPYANMMGYPFLPPQSYAYMPSAFQQAIAGNSAYHQSLAAAAVLPQQYKNSSSISNMPQSAAAAIASGYGALGNATTIPGNFQMNPSAGLSGATLNYDDVLSSQYKDNSHLISLQQQQNENSAMWQQQQQQQQHGANSRTMSAIPASAFYNYQQAKQQQQNQQQQQQPPDGFRQTHQVSQNYGTLGGYPNYYHSQAGSMSHEQQQNNPRDGGSLGGGSQGQQQFQSWPNSGY